MLWFLKKRDEGLLFFRANFIEGNLSDTRVSRPRGTIAPMIRTHTLNPQEAALVAVSALDDLVTDLVRSSPVKLSARFFDWVADEATPFVEYKIHTAFTNPAFTGTLHRGDARIALSQWVNHWVCPHIARCFSPLAEHLPVHAAAPALLKPVHDFTLPACIAKPQRPTRVASHPLAAAIQAAF